MDVRARNDTLHAGAWIVGRINFQRARTGFIWQLPVADRPPVEADGPHAMPQSEYTERLYSISGDGLQGFFLGQGVFFFGPVSGDEIEDGIPAVIFLTSTVNDYAKSPRQRASMEVKRGICKREICKRKPCIDTHGYHRTAATRRTTHGEVPGVAVASPAAVACRGCISMVITGRGLFGAVRSSSSIVTNAVPMKSGERQPV
jgi:hypothetical protein